MKHEWGEKGCILEFWWESQKEERPLQRPRNRWENNNKIDLNVIGWCGVDWINLA
jgi:hypothetical protein